MFGWLLLLGAGNRALGQAVPSPQDWLIDTWQSDDGLPHSSVTSLAQTPDGYLWIGTYNGLARFDGVRFTLFDPANTPALINPRVAWLGVDTAGALWVCTEDGSLAVRQRSEFRPVRVGGGEGIRGKSLTSARSGEVLLLASDGKLWRQVGSNEGTNQLESLTPPGGGIVTSVGRDADGRVWCLYGRGKIARWTAAGFEGPLANLQLKGKRVHSLEADVAGRVWIGTDEGLTVFEAGRLEDVTPTNGEPAQVFTGMTLSGDGGAWVMADGRLRKCVARRWVADAGLWTNKFEPVSIPVGEHVDQEGGIWFTHYGSGLLHVGLDGRERWLKMQDGLPGERLSCWLQDREGNVWAGLNRAGLVRLRQRRFQVLGVAEGLRERTVMSVCEDRDGAIWAGTFGGGLHRWANGVMEAFDVGVRDRNVVASVFPDRTGRVWVGTGGDGVFVWEGGALKRPLPEASAPQTGHAIFEDSRRRIWIGNASGLFLWAERKWRRLGGQDGFNSQNPRAVAEEAAGAVWIGTGDGGVYRFEDEKFTEFRPTDSQARQPVWSLLPDVDGTLWVGTFRGGLLRFKDGAFTRCTTKDGLPSDVICHILDGGNGQLWMSSHAGIVRVDKAALHAFADGQAKSVPCVAYGKHDGLPTVECSGNYQPAGWRGRDGRLWFATVKGVVSVQPSEVTTTALAPPVVIEEVLVDGKSEIRNA